MKNPLIVLGFFFLLLALGVVGIVGYAFYRGTQLNATSSAYVNQVVPPILSTWSVSALRDQGSPELLKDVPPAAMAALFKNFSRLGTFTNCHPAQGQCKTTYTPQRGKMIFGDYLIHAFFQNGDAIVTVRVVQFDGRWRIFGFSVDSPLFVQ